MIWYHWFQILNVSPVFFSGHCAKSYRWWADSWRQGLNLKYVQDNAGDITLQFSGMALKPHQSSRPSPQHLCQFPCWSTEICKLNWVSFYNLYFGSGLTGIRFNQWSYPPSQLNFAVILFQEQLTTFQIHNILFRVFFSQCSIIIFFWFLLLYFFSFNKTWSFWFGLTLIYCICFQLQFSPKMNLSLLAHTPNKLQLHSSKNLKKRVTSLMAVICFSAFDNLKCMHAHL